LADPATPCDVDQIRLSIYHIFLPSWRCSHLQMLAPEVQF